MTPRRPNQSFNGSLAQALFTREQGITTSKGYQRIYLQSPKIVGLKEQGQRVLHYRSTVGGRALRGVDEPNKPRVIRDSELLRERQIRPICASIVPSPGILCYYLGSPWSRGEVGLVAY